MSSLRYIEGLVLLLVVAGGAVSVAVSARRRVLPAWSGAEARLAEAVAALAVLTLQCELLGLVGALRAVPLLIVGLVLVLGGAVSARRRLAHVTRVVVRVPAPAPAERVLVGAGGPPVATAGESVTPDTVSPRPDRPAPPPLGLFGAAVVVGSTVLVFVQWCVRIRPVFRLGIFDFDSLDYHLPTALQWAQSGRVGPVLQTVPGLPVGYYPSNTELLSALGMIAWRNDLLDLVLNLGWLALALLAAYVLGRRRGVAPVTVPLTALVLAVPLLAGQQPGSAMNDTATIALVVGTVALLDAWRVERSDPRSAVLALAALCAGLALGTKLTALPLIAILTLALIVLPPSTGTSRLRLAGTWFAGLAVGGGFWYLRNLVLVGNPMPANRVPFGVLGLPTPYWRQFEEAKQSVAHYLGDRAVLEVYAQTLRTVLGPLWAPLVVVALLGMAVAIVRTGSRLGRILGVAAFLAFVAYLVTPTTAGGPEGQPLLFAVDVRYVLPILVVGLLLLATELAARPKLLAAGSGLASVALLVTVGAKWTIPPAPDQRRTWTAVLALLVGVTVALVIVAARRLPVRRAAVLGAVVALVVVTVGPVGAALAGTYARNRYATVDSQSSAVYHWFQPLSHVRVATTGFALSYPLGGARLTNRVRYLGAVTDGAMDDYPTCAAWKQALSAGRYDYVVTGPLFPDSSEQPRAEAWAAGDPALAERFSSGAVHVYAVVGTPEAGRCR